jgi:hypothetical protein
MLSPRCRIQIGDRFLHESSSYLLIRIELAALQEGRCQGAQPSLWLNGDNASLISSAHTPLHLARRGQHGGAFPHMTRVCLLRYVLDNATGAFRQFQ